MFDMQNLRAILARSNPVEEQPLDELRGRIAELEAENSSLRRLGDTIRKNARLFNSLLQRSYEGILLVSPDLIVLRLIHSSIGYAEIELSGQSVLPLIHPDDAIYFQKAFSQLLSAQAKEASCEFRLKRKDGSWAWLACAMTDMLDDPDVQAILLNGRNITEQKEQAGAVERLESFRDCSEYAMFSKGVDGVIMDWNPGAQEAFGYSAEEIVGQSVAQLVPSGLLGEEISTRERIARGEDVPAFHTTRIRKDGRSVEIDLKLAPVWDSQGRVKAVTHLSRVINCAGCR